MLFRSFTEQESDVIDMYTVDGMKEQEIAKATGLTLLEVNDILYKYENGDVDYSEEDSEACRYCGGDCPSDEDNACDGYLGDVDGMYDGD